MKNKKLLIISYEGSLPLLFDKGHPIVNPTGGAAIEEYELINELVQKDTFELGLISWKGSKKHFVSIERNIRLFEIYDKESKKSIFYILSLLLVFYKFRPHYVFIKGNNISNYIAHWFSKFFGFLYVFRFSSDLQVDELPLAETKRHRLIVNIINFVFGKKLPKADIFICQNEYQASKLMSQFNNSRVHVVYDFINCNCNLPEVKPFHGRRYIAWVGRFCKEKNIPLLYEIVRDSPEICFKIAGAFSGEIHYDTSLAIDNLKKCGNVEFVGLLHPDMIIPFLSKSYSLLMTSFVEGFSRTILESFLAGTPVVLTSKIDPSSIIFKNDLGEAVPKHEDLNKAVKRLLKRSDYS
ncbi:MAG: glycosyltransferase [Saprospiraceae bacterium]|nr:glycosyltransferase [Saprospiraceae bacterium]